MFNLVCTTRTFYTYLGYISSLLALCSLQPLAASFATINHHCDGSKPAIRCQSGTVVVTRWVSVRARSLTICLPRTSNITYLPHHPRHHTTETMLAELLLVLGGHPSTLFLSTGVSPELAAYLHPGEVASLNTLCSLAANYTRIRRWTEATQAEARAAVLASSRRKGKEREREGREPGQYVAVLAGAVREVLEEYESLLVETEALVLSRDPGTVQPSEDKEGLGYVPLSLVLATFDAWHAPMAALSALVTHLEEESTPGELMQHLSEQSATGHPTLRKVFTQLLQRLWDLWLTHLVVFLLDGVASDSSSPSSPALGLDAGADPPHRLYKLNSDLLPRSVGAPTRESILYVGRVAATLKREGRALPRSLVDKTRRDIVASKPEELDAAVQRARAEVGEWLWRHVLTGEQVAEAIESL